MHDEYAVAQYTDTYYRQIVTTPGEMRCERDESPYRHTMEKKACACGLSALEMYRASKRLIPTLLDKPRTGSLQGCSLPPAVHLEDSFVRLGVTSKPYHLLIDGTGSGFSRSDVVRHIATPPLPPRALIKLSDSLYVVGPELLFLQLAACPDLDEIDLIEIGFELCGTYVIDSSWDGLTNTGTPLTSVSKIGNMLDKLPGRDGIQRARTALGRVRDNSNSPMETTLAMLISLPTSEGGLGIGRIELNRPVPTPVGRRKVDISFPGRQVGLEYKGREYHSIEAVGRDDRRQNKLAGSGMTILNVWYEDLSNEHLFNQLTDDLFRALGRRRRIRANGFETKQKLLRTRLMPAIMKYG